jgi:hypothetical protein
MKELLRHWMVLEVEEKVWLEYLMSCGSQEGAGAARRQSWRMQRRWKWSRSLLKYRTNYYKIRDAPC